MANKKLFDLTWDLVNAIFEEFKQDEKDRRATLLRNGHESTEEPLRTFCERVQSLTVRLMEEITTQEPLKEGELTTVLNGLVEIQAGGRTAAGSTI